jgi:hypothetical protein
MSLELSLSGFNRDLEKVIELTGRAAGVVIRQEGKLFVEDCIALTPPFGNAPSTENSKAQEKIGKAAVARDISKVFQPLTKIRAVESPTNTALAKRIKKLVRARNFDALTAILKNLGFKNIRILERAEGSYHIAARDSRGHVGKRAALNFVFNAPSVNQYIRKEQNKVGFAKAGWCQAAAALKAKVPAWIKKHAGAAGSVIDNTRDKLNPHIIVANEVPYIQKAGQDLRIIQRALDSRRVNLKAKIEFELNREWGKVKAA